MSNKEWALITESAPQCNYPLREVFNGRQWIVRAGVPWRMMPNDLPPWEVVYQRTQRWIGAGVFEAVMRNLRAILRLTEGRVMFPSAAILDSRTMQSTPESGACAGYDGAKRRKGSKVHIAVDTLGHLLALHVTPANERDRAQVAELCEQVQAATGESVEPAYVDQGYSDELARKQAATHGIVLEVVKLLDTKRWVVERSFAWPARFRRPTRDNERLPEILASLHYLTSAILMAHRVVDLFLEVNYRL